MCEQEIEMLRIELIAKLQSLTDDAIAALFALMVGDGLLPAPDAST